MTPHFTSAIAAFGIVFSVYFAIVASEVWFVYRRHFVASTPCSLGKLGRTVAGDGSPRSSTPS